MKNVKICLSKPLIVFLLNNEKTKIMLNLILPLFLFFFLLVFLIIFLFYFEV